jgi:hypothetical protein
MEACSSSHDWARTFALMAFPTELIPAFAHSGTVCKSKVFNNKISRLYCVSALAIKILALVSSIRCEVFSVVGFLVVSILFDMWLMLLQNKTKQNKTK